MSSLDQRQEDNDQFNHEKCIVFQSFEYPSFNLHQNNLGGTQQDEEDEDDSKQIDYLKKRLERSNSKLYSNYLFLKKLNHNNLCSYFSFLEYEHRQHVSIILQEFYNETLNDILSFKKEPFQEADIVKIAFQIISALVYLEKNGIILPYLSAKQIHFINKDYNVKISDYGKFYLDNSLLKTMDLLQLGTDSIVTLPPEYFLFNEFTRNSAIWSLGILMIQCLDINKQNFIQTEYIQKDNVLAYIKDLLQLTTKYQNQSVFQKFSYLQDYNNNLEKYLNAYNLCNAYSYEFRDFMSKCLYIFPSQRWQAVDLLRHPVFKHILDQNSEYSYKQMNNPSNYKEKKEFLFSRLITQLKFQKTIDQDLLQRIFDLNDLVCMLSPNLNEILANIDLINLKNLNKDIPLIIRKSEILQSNNNSLNAGYASSPCINAIIIQTKLLYTMIQKDILTFQPLLVKQTKDFSKWLVFFDQSNQNGNQKSQTLLNQDTQSTSSQSTQNTINGQKVSKQDQENQEKSFGFFKKTNLASKVTRLLSKSSSQKQSSHHSADGSSQIQSQMGGGGLGSNDADDNEQLFQDIFEQQQSTTQGFDGSLVSQMLKNYLFYLSLISQSQTVNPSLVLEYLSFVQIPDTLRPIVWKKILGIDCSNHNILYDFLICTDNIYPEKRKEILQIEQDIPRCHQYNSFANSYQGKVQLCQLLQAFMQFDKKNVYLQGIDSMAFITLLSFDFDEAVACAALNEITKKHLKMHGRDLPEDYILRERITLFKYLLMFEEPILSVHLEEIKFGPEMYTVSWFLNLFSMIFETKIVQRIWDFALCNTNFIVTFSIALLIELKDHLLLKDQNELMSCIKNLEGLNNVELCLNYASYLLKNIPSNFFVLNYLHQKEELEEFKGDFYNQRPWEIPPELKRVQSRKCFFVNIFDLVKMKVQPIYLDVRSTSEYEECCVNNSLFLHHSDGKIPENVLEYLDKKCQGFYGFEQFEENFKQGDKKTPNEINIFVIVWNYEKGKECTKALNCLFKGGIKRICVLNGGIQSVLLDQPEQLKKKNKITPLNYFKRKM